MTKNFFSSDFNEIFFVYDSDDFKIKKLRFIADMPLSANLFLESPQPKSIRGLLRAVPPIGGAGGPSPAEKKNEKKNFDKNIFSSNIIFYQK